MDLRAFYDGKEFDLDLYLGAHTVAKGVVFRVYAPAAKGVAVIGEFSDWQPVEMHRVDNGQFWEVWVEAALAGEMYKYRIYTDNGFMDHADPFAFASELRPGNASVIYDRDRYQFHDQEWMSKRNVGWDRPLNIYEMHLGSWRRKDDHEELAKRIDEAKERGEGIDVKDGWYSYEEIADLLVPYLKENGYNAVEFMPLNEYPADESWGYQSTGFFSATARYGDPDGLKILVDRLHQENISVVLDIVTVHFATDAYALANFDGTQLYEYNNSAIDISEWGSCNFNHSRGDICSFLNSASDFWIREYHFDGLRFDAVGNLIYWFGNESRGVNTTTVQFIRNMNQGLKSRHPEVMLIAEDSSAYPGVTKPIFDGGLGFDYKWDMGWMNDTLTFFRTGPAWRPENYHKLTFSMAYFYNEKYMLTFSHDEVVHGKATIMQKMSGEYEEKFPQERALQMYMFTHPGKKLNFMGNEIGQLREWDEKREQDWFITKYPLHDAFHHYQMKLNEVYASHPGLWEKDYDRDGFRWLEADDTEHCIYAYVRSGWDAIKGAQENILCVFNFSDKPQTFNYKEGQKLTLLLDSDDERWGGSTKVEAPKKKAAAKKVAEKKQTSEIQMPAFSGKMFIIE